MGRQIQAGRQIPAGETGSDDERDLQLAVRPKSSVRQPELYRVLLLNDDYTPMEFVIYILKRFFHKSADSAVQIMLHVHNTGVGECGVYAFEIAEAKVTQVMDCARRHQHPLQCLMEKK